MGMLSTWCIVHVVEMKSKNHDVEGAGDLGVICCRSGPKWGLVGSQLVSPVDLHLRLTFCRSCLPTGNLSGLIDKPGLDCDVGWGASACGRALRIQQHSLIFLGHRTV
eukprot:1253474-Pleurochrysis_carterae.AAC.1